MHDVIQILKHQSNYRKVSNLGTNEGLKRGLKIIDSLLVKLWQLEHKKSICFLELVFSGDQALSSLLGFDNVRSGFLQFVLLFKFCLAF